MAAASEQHSWHVERLAGALGAQVTNVDLEHIDPLAVTALKALLTTHMVLFFPDQHLTEETHLALGRKFGELEANPNLKNPFTKHPEFFELVASEGGIADEWHTDLTFMPEPSLMSILHMVTCPETGGDTMWTSLCAAYDALSAPMQQMCEGLSALHDAHPHDRADRMAIHPVVRVHPETGRKALYVNEHFTRRIVEMNSVESDHLLRFLTSWVQRPEFTVRFRWSTGAVAMWDNRCTQHYVLTDFVGERAVQRVTISGDKPQGAPPRWAPCIGRKGASAMARHDRQLARFLAGDDYVVQDVSKHKA
ncbi:MAG: TauD/TfdA family dioxygenase [Gammaproteobacteria bacterium]|nr:TauD/TfdA family dioxygenase [Gammaproteobacteria bacterium]